MTSSRHIRSALLALLCAAGGLAAAEDPVPRAADTLLTPPKAEEIAAFANDVKLPGDFKGVAVTVDKEKIMEFFSGAEVKPAFQDRGRWRTLTDLTLPEKISNNPILVAARKQSAHMPNGKVFFSAFIHTGGVVVTDAGAVYFWQLWNDRVLELDDESGRACLLVLGADAKPCAAFAHPYGEFDGAKQPGKKLYGKLPMPAAADIIAFSNRPESDGEGRRNYLFRGRMEDYLSGCSNISGSVPWLARFDGGLNPFTSGVNAAYLKKGADPNLRRSMEGGGDIEVVCDGVAVTRDKRILFWRMGNDGNFYFMDEHHRTCCATSAANPQNNKWLSAASLQFNMGGSPRLSVITLDAMRAGADWDANQPPPLDRENAVRSAWRELSQAANERDAGAWRVTRVATTRFSLYGQWNGPSSSAAWKWYYTVYFENQRAPGVEIPVLVSMDGTAGGIYEPDAGAKKLQEAQEEFNKEHFSNQGAEDADALGKPINKAQLMEEQKAL